MKRNWIAFLVTAALATGWVALAGEADKAAPAPAKVQFNRDIRPILSENCLACHGPDPASRKAGMRLDVEEGLFGERKKGA